MNLCSAAVARCEQEHAAVRCGRSDPGPSASAIDCSVPVEIDNLEGGGWGGRRGGALKSLVAYADSSLPGPGRKAPPRRFRPRRAEAAARSRQKVDFFQAFGVPEMRREVSTNCSRSMLAV